MPQDDRKTVRRSIANDILLPEVIRMTAEGHTVTLPLRGFSMRPFLEDRRDKALLAAPKGISCGDVVLALIDGGRYVLHRIVRIDGDKVTLLGDGNLNSEHCTTADIKAKAIAFYRKGRGTPDHTTGRKWLIYSWWWTRLYPIRRYLLFIHRHLFV